MPIERVRNIEFWPNGGISEAPPYGQGQVRRGLTELNGGSFRQHLLTGKTSSNVEDRTAARFTGAELPMRGVFNMVSNLSKTDKEAIAFTILGEVGAGSAADMSSIAWVIRNRAESGRFPSNMAAVALQANSRGVHQFSTWNTAKFSGNQPMSTWSKDSAAFKRALRTVDSVVTALPNEDPTRGATHYYAGTGANAISKPKWFDHEAPEGTVQIGHHSFGAKVPAGAYDHATAAPAPLTPESMADARLRQDAEQLASMGVSGSPYTPRVGIVPGGWISDPAVGALRGTGSTISAEELGSPVYAGQWEARYEATHALMSERLQSMLVPQVNPNLVSRTVRSVRIDPMTGQPASDAEEAVHRLVESKAQQHVAQAPSAAARTVRALEVTTRGTDRTGQQITDSHGVNAPMGGVLEMRGGARSGTGFGGTAEVHDTKVNLVRPEKVPTLPAQPKVTFVSPQGKNNMASSDNSADRTVGANAGKQAGSLADPNAPNLGLPNDRLNSIHDKRETAYQPKFVTVVTPIKITVPGPKGAEVPNKDASKLPPDSSVEPVGNGAAFGGGWGAEGLRPKAPAQVVQPKPATPTTRVVTVYKTKQVQVPNPVAPTPHPLPPQIRAYDPRVDVTGVQAQHNAGGWGINAGGGIVP